MSKRPTPSVAGLPMSLQMIRAVKDGLRAFRLDAFIHQDEFDLVYRHHVGGKARAEVIARAIGERRFNAFHEATGRGNIPQPG